jgi:hypothetical protein
MDPGGITVLLFCPGHSKRHYLTPYIKYCIIYITLILPMDVINTINLKQTALGLSPPTFAVEFMVADNGHIRKAAELQMLRTLNESHEKQG